MRVPLGYTLEIRILFLKALGIVYVLIREKKRARVTWLYGELGFVRRDRILVNQSIVVNCERQPSQKAIDIVLFT